MVKTQNIDVEKLALARKRAGITSDKFCRELGISRQSFCNKCNGKTKFRLPEVYVMSDLMRLTDAEKDEILADRKSVV